ncbi:MAG: LysM peptidoglycan-binding domain-containing protein, partial [Candidatus Limnocylindrales bacterium]
PLSRPSDTDAPSWERPRRFEAYPTLRTRTGFGGLSPVLLGLVALVAAAAILFVLPGLLSKGGLASPTATPTGAATASPVASATVAATSGPPTPLFYTVKTGDTLSAIAQRFGVTVDALKAANPQIKDINKIGIGDRITIPPAAPSTSASVRASGSAGPTGTSAP